MIPEIRLLAAKTSRDNDNLWLPLVRSLKRYSWSYRIPYRADGYRALYMMRWRFREKREYD